MIHRRPARRTSGGCERKGSGWQGGQGGRGRAATRCGGRAATHLHRGPTAGPSKSHRTLCVALEILLRQGSTRPSSASVTQNFALKQRETDGNNSASVNLRHCVSKTENVEWPLRTLDKHAGLNCHTGDATIAFVSRITVFHIQSRGQKPSNKSPTSHTAAEISSSRTASSKIPASISL